MSKQTVPTLPERREAPYQREAPVQMPPDATEKKPWQYLKEKGWFPLGDPEAERLGIPCLWLPPGFTLIEKYETVIEPMANEVERYESGKALLAQGKIASNPKPAERKQTRVTPRSTAIFTAAAYMQQMRQDLEDRERQLREETRLAG